MDEFKIWEIDNRSGAGITSLPSSRRTESEGLLEDIVTRNPDMLAASRRAADGNRRRPVAPPRRHSQLNPDYTFERLVETCSEWTVKADWYCTQAVKSKDRSVR